MFSSREIQKNDSILPGYFEQKVEYFFGITIALDDILGCTPLPVAMQYDCKKCKYTPLDNANMTFVPKGHIQKPEVLKVTSLVRFGYIYIF